MAKRANGLGAGALLTLLGAAPAAGQLCIPEWSTEFVGGDPLHTVRAQVVFDDGSGPKLFAGDRGGVWRWDGTEWTRVGQAMPSGNNPGVHALAVFDAGQGPRLIAGGDFDVMSGVGASNLAVWDGGVWSSIGGVYNFSGGLSAEGVRALHVHDGSLYVGGGFTRAGTVDAMRIARWTGSAWSALGAGLSGGGNFENGVYALASYGGMLHAAGGFTYSGQTEVDGVARWTGTAWQSVGGGIVLGGKGRALAVYNPGIGEQLFLGGNFQGLVSAPGVRMIARWNGNFWQPLPGVGAGLNGPVQSLYVDPAGGGLVVTGAFTAAGSAAGLGGIAHFNGAWTSLGAGLGPTVTTTTMARTVVRHDDGSGSALYAGGGFIVMPGLGVNGIARWDGNAWDAVTEERMGAVHNGGGVWALEEAGGRALYFGGMEAIGALPVNGALRWDGENWSVLGPLPPGVRIVAMEAFDSGNGKEVYASWRDTFGRNSTIARWDGAAWQAVGTISTSETYGWAESMAVYDDGSGAKLYIAGDFDQVHGVAAANIARWDGAAWQPVAGGIGGSLGSGPYISTMTVHSGALYVGGPFSLAGGTAVSGAARYDGAWSGLGLSPAGYGMRELVSAQVGAGRELLGLAATHPSAVYRHNGSGWTGYAPLCPNSLGGGLIQLDLGDGPMLYATGTMSSTPDHWLHRWTGSVWEPVYGGLNGAGTGIGGFDPDGEGPRPPELWVIGAFSRAGDIDSFNIASLRGCVGCYANCDGSTAAPVLNVADFTCFLRRFGAGDAAANCDGSTGVPALNVGDFTCFLQRFAAGCP